MIAVLCNKNGKTQVGTDGYLDVDGRFTLENQINQAREYRERFKKHFMHKYDFWTHVMFVQSTRNLPDPHNNRPMPRRHSL